jgi:tetratricopeptide (TPR) repeat protein
VSTRVDLDELARLEEERAFLLRSLDDLERERAAGDLADDDYATLRDGYTARAATVLRAIEAGRADLPARPPVRWGRVLAIVAVLVLVGGLTGMVVARSAGQRQPGDTVTGDLPDTVNAELARARSLFTAGDLLPAIEAFDRALAADPGNAEALTYRGWLLALVGNQGGQPELIGRGEASIDLAIAAAPAYVDAQCFKAVVRFRLHGDAEGAKGPIEACVAGDPPPEVRAAVDGLQAEIDAALG